MEEDESWIIDALAEKAYNAFWENINSSISYFEIEKPESFDMVSQNTKDAWKAVVSEIIKSYPTMDNLETEESKKQ